MNRICPLFQAHTNTITTIGRDNFVKEKKTQPVVYGGLYMLAPTLYIGRSYSSILPVRYATSSDEM